MESVYYVLSWACHRKCVHCYDTRFRPYVRGALEDVVRQGEQNAPKIIANLPERMTYLDLASPLPEGGYREKVGRIILAGGEVLLDPVRERVLYPTLDALIDRYGASGIKIIVQTTGDLVTERIINDLLARGVWMISIAGMDDYHVGLEGDRRRPLVDTLHRWFDAAGVRPSGWQASKDEGIAWSDEDGPVHHFFGATDDAWIGKLWPRGRAWENGLSKATIEDNFCAAWSGAKGFLDYRYSGSEVAIEPSGDVFPCCMKTRRAIGNLTEEKLTDILDSLAGHPVYEALNAGRPDRMGLGFGWDMTRFLGASETTAPNGAAYRNLCIGCDRFHEEVLAPIIDELRARRRASRPGLGVP